MFKKILVVNRGEIALRVIRTAKEMGIRTAIVYSTADRDSLPVKFADESICIGGPNSRDSYLNIPRIMAAAELTNADSIHPGYGFLSENSKFAKICKKSNIKFIGPSPDAIEKMGNKSMAKSIMEKSKVPCIRGSKGILKDYREAEKIADKIGYPVILKARSGGGGKGMRIINEKKEIKYNFDVASREALSSFNDAGIYLEKLIENPRHIEVQIVGDSHGRVCHLSERDCTIQRRHQKLIEESPSMMINSKIRKKIGDIAIRAGKAINYEGAGTIEFLMDKKGDFYFMEMNTRIQVEHGITEEVVGYDLIREQIKVAMGEKISGKNYLPKLHSIECRINAEDPFNNFMPCPGKITNFHSPGGHGIRVDTHVYSGYTISPYYDSMIAKLITTARTREEAISKMRRSLEEFIIGGVKTTIPIHERIMRSEKFIKGNYDITFMDTNKDLLK